MARIGVAWSRLREYMERTSMEREMDEEMRYHIERDTERNIARGMTPDAARRAALVSFGGVDRFKEAAREEQRSRPVEDLWQDLAYCVRALRRSPVFAIVAIASLALGIGANTAVFSVVDAVLLKPLPYAEPERLFRVGLQYQALDVGDAFSVADVDAFESAQSFTSLGAASRPGSGIALTGADQAESITGSWITPGVLSALNVAPALGRLMLAAEGEPGGDRVVVLSHEFWRDRFGAAPDVIDRTLILDGLAHTVIGVMPRGFRLPGSARDDVWPVLQLDAPTYRAPFWLTTVARLAPDVTVAQARSELAAIERTVKAAYPETSATWSYMMTPLKDVLVRDSRATILVLFGAVALVLLIAAANVANLLLARSATRAPELALRSALGAARGRIVRQLLAESLLIALLGAGLGIVLAFAGVAALGSLTPEGMARFHEVHVDHRVLLFTLGVSLLTGIAVGIAPALRAPTAVAAGIREGGRSAGDGRGRNRLRNALVVAEFALALGVLIGAGLLVSSLVRLQNVELGTTRHDVLVVRIALPAAQYAEESSVGTFFDALIERVERLPGVGAAAVSMAVPPRRLVMTNPFTPEGRVYGPQDEPPVVQQLLVSPAYFDVFGIPIGSGRVFSTADRDGAPLVAIVNTALAQQYFPGQDPVGRWLQLGAPSPDARRWTIVGVAPDVHYSGLEHGDEPTVYVSYAQNLWWRSMYLVLRTSGDPLALVPSIRAEVAALDPNVPLREVRTMDQLLQEAVAQPRFRTLLLGAFAGIALLLAAAGIYGVMSYTVNQRRREMSIRLALGARPSEIIRLVVGRGMLLAGAGVLLGLVVAASLSRLMQSMLFEVGALDVPTFAAAAAFLALVALSACFVPAIRAGRVEAAAALRSE